MIRTLVAIEVDLTSSFAIRFACQLSTCLKMELCPVYVKSDISREDTTGVGWVRHTWEREIIREGKVEIAEMIASEAEFCPTLAEPRVIYGDRDAELARLLERESFHLYVEGAPYPFTPETIYKRLHSRLYQRLTQPLIWLRAVKKVDRVLLLCPDLAAPRALARTFESLWSGCATPLHLAHPAGAGEDLLQEVAQARQSLEAAGLSVSLTPPFQPTAGGPPADFLKDYGLVGVALEAAGRKDSPQLQWLSRVKNPLLLTLV
jgi:hypothetical protein